MDWIILSLVVPAVLIPVVLLCGFAGCQLVFQLEEVEEQPPAPVPPSPPNLLAARPRSATSVELSWESPDPSAVKFGVFRAETGGTLVQIDEAPASPYTDSAGLLEGKSYLYSLVAISAENLPSVQSNIVPVSLVFRTAFSANLGQNEPGRNGHCVVQKIGAFDPTKPNNPANLSNVTGGVFRLSIRGTVNLQIAQIFISQSAVPTVPNPMPDPWDPGADLTAVASNVTLPTNTETALPTVLYLLDPSKDLLVAFDIPELAGSGNLRFAAITGATGYVKLTTPEAGIPDRSADFEERPGQMYLVAKIEML